MCKKFLILFFPLLLTLHSAAAHCFIFVHIPGSPWNTTITVWNTGDHAADAVLKIRGVSETFEHSINIPANGRTVLKSGTDFELGESGELTTESDRLQVKLSYQYKTSPSVSEFFIDANKSGKKFLLQNTIMDWTDWFGMAFYNPNPFSITLALHAWKEGAKIADSQLSLPPFRKQVVLWSDIWPNLPQSGLDTVIVESNGYIPLPISITGNIAQDRHVFFQGRILRESDINYRKEMRLFVERISEIGKAAVPGFFIVPQNGQELFTDTGEPDGTAESQYLTAIDATGKEDMFFGYSGDNIATPADARAYYTALLNIGKSAGVEVLVTDYCYTQSKVDESYQLNRTAGFIPFAASDRNLGTIPPYPTHPIDENNNSIETFSSAKNFLYLINPSNFGDDRTNYLNTLDNTNYDILILDLFFNDNSPLTNAELQQLKTKPGGGKRIVLCYMSIGEAENYRYYWQTEWATAPPSWLMAENPNWPGNYAVKYWKTPWLEIILNPDTGYLKKIINAGFDGVYLDKIDLFEHFE